MRILVVDDCPDNARMMKILLKRSGHEVKTAGDGLEAVAVAGSFRPDVVFLDLTLPGMSGPRVAEELRKDGLLGDVVIIAISGYGADKVSALFDGHFTKPVDHDELGRFLARLAPATSPTDVLPKVANAV